MRRAADVSVDDLRYLVAVARAGKLVTAAEALRVDHTTVRRRIDRLETALGVRLIDRGADGWMLTAVGREVVARSAGLDDVVQALLARPASSAQRRRLRDYSESPAFVAVLAVLESAAPAEPNRRDAQGRHHSLTVAFDRVNHDYFSSTLLRPGEYMPQDLANEAVVVTGTYDAEHQLLSPALSPLRGRSLPERFSAILAGKGW